ncbi:MAG: glutathione S-transferase family protein [Gammaproteobacteria bacterium]
MIKLYYWPTPNGHKASIMLEEVGLEYEVYPVNILEGEQFDPEFLKICPNNKIPAIVDTDGPNHEAYSLFESGAILMYLAEKTGKLWPGDPLEMYNVMQWLMFQMGNVGPMFGQNGYFQGYAKEEVPYAIARYHNETKRLYGVMDKRLAGEEYLAGNHYSIADVATYPWTMPKQWELHRIDIDEFPHVKRWNATVAERPAVQRGVAVMAEEIKVGNPTDEAFESLFGETQYQQHIK